MFPVPGQFDKKGKEDGAAAIISAVIINKSSV
jgi:hypothetical protein